MLKKAITFSDLDGNPVTSEFYFNLSKAELAELELSFPGGFAEYLQRIIKDQDGKAIIESFKNVIRMAYGVRSDDGRRFIKSEELWLDFSQTDAYSVLFMELVTDADSAAEFVRGIVPADMEPVTQKKIVDVPIPDNPVRTEVDYESMTREELIRSLTNTPPPA